MHNGATIDDLVAAVERAENESKRKQAGKALRQRVDAEMRYPVDSMAEFEGDEN